MGVSDFSPRRARASCWCRGGGPAAPFRSVPPAGAGSGPAEKEAGRRIRRSEERPPAGEPRARGATAPRRGRRARPAGRPGRSLSLISSVRTSSAFFFSPRFRSSPSLPSASRGRRTGIGRWAARWSSRAIAATGGPCRPLGAGREGGQTPQTQVQLFGRISPKFRYFFRFR